MKFSMLAKSHLVIKTALFAAAMAIMQCIANSALAAPVLYQYSTATNPSGVSGGAIDYFGSGAFVSGTFMYDAAAPSTGTGSNGATNYGGNITVLTGTVQGLSFSDERGRTQVGDELLPGPVDNLNLNSEPDLYTNLTGFDIGSYTLINVRMFWLEGQLGITDFLSSEDLPAVLPSFQGRLALDFVPTGTFPTTPNFDHSVFFDGLMVTVAIPEPEIYAMMGIGLGLMGWIGRRRTQQVV